MKLSVDKLALALAVAGAALAWIIFAEHPTAKNLRAALIDTALI